MFFFLKKNKLYVKKILKYENNNNKEKIIIWVLLFKIFESSFVGKKPPEEIIEKAKFKESKLLIEIKFKTIKMNKVNPEYKRKILIDCFKISELLKDK